MKTADIMEVFVTGIEETIIKEWRHDGFICGWSSEHANFEIDEKEYVVKIREVKEGGHWSENIERKDNER